MGRHVICQSRVRGKCFGKARSRTQRIRLKKKIQIKEIGQLCLRKGNDIEEWRIYSKL